MHTPIYPMALIPRTNIPFKLYFLAFPQKWKELLIKLQLSVDPKFNLMYNLKTNVLYGYLNGWLDDVVQLSPMKSESDDSRWLVSMTEPDVDKICEILKIWIIAEYKSHYKKTDETEILATDLISSIDPETLRKSIRSEETVMFDNKGHALTDYAFNAFALYAANALTGKTITVSGHDITLSNCGQKMLMSQPLSDEKENANYYSIGLQLSLQTTPPERNCMLLVDCSVKRFISDIKECDYIYLSEDIHAYVAMGNNKYRKITLSQKINKDSATGRNKYPHYWNDAERKCYDLYNCNILPDADDVLYHPEQYLSEHSKAQILMPYKNGMEFTRTRIGTGISVKDKHDIFDQVAALMKNFADKADPASPISQSKIVHLKTDKSLDEKYNLRRERLKHCIGSSELRIEIYGHSSDKELADNIISEFEAYLGGDEYQSTFPVYYFKKEIGSLGDMMPDGSFSSHCQRIDIVKRSIAKSDEITGAIVILADTRNNPGDPKQALRAGFADTNRITQFITPDKQSEKEQEPSKHRIHGAVMDLLRQFGYTEFYENRNMKKNPAFESDAVGMYVLHQLKPLSADRSKSAKDVARFLPVYVTYNVRSGIIYVDCDLLEKRHMSYPEALIAFSRLSRENDFVQKCVDASRGGFRTKLLGLHSLYREKPAALLVQANGITRSQWYGMTDKSISEYNYKDKYIPEKIEIGTKALSDVKSFCDTGIRIIRVRDNFSTHEVPDYYTEISKKGEHISSSGVYAYKDVFWGLESRPNNPEYTLSYKKSKLDAPNLDFDECGSVEYYPMQLQVGDDAEQWAAYTNYLREVMPEVNRSVLLPAPLHFASLIEEYLLLSKYKK